MSSRCGGWGPFHFVELLVRPGLVEAMVGHLGSLSLAEGAAVGNFARVSVAGHWVRPATWVSRNRDVGG